MSFFQKKLICIGGPTASGKTKLSVALAKRIDAEIISVDSRQIYRGLDIGTAKVTASEMQGVCHHMIDILAPHENFTAAQFAYRADAIIQDIWRRNKSVILVGGTGLYFHALLYGLDDLPEIPPNIREKWNHAFAKNGLSHLQSLVQQIDPVFYEQTDEKNPRRLLRALEVFEASGRKLSSFRTGQKTARYDSQNIYLQPDRELLYERINARVIQMLDHGLEQEVRGLLMYRDMQCLQTVGYKEMLAYIDGLCNLTTAVSEIQKNSRRYAKRQYTWFTNKEYWQPITDMTAGIETLLA